MRIGYVVETPIWKTSYRLLLDDKATTGQLQGWAIVENQTESDWNDVSLSLVSGRPISFMMDLYQPLYATRPTVVPELFAGLRPQVYDGGDRDGQRDRVAMTRSAPGGLSSGWAKDRLRSRRQDRSQCSSTRSSPPARPYVSAAARRWTRCRPSSRSRRRRSSASCSSTPSATSRCRARSRRCFRSSPTASSSSGCRSTTPSVLPTNPLNGVRLKNTTGKHLLQGPVTVLDKGGYAGDARIDNVPPGQERLLSYGIDLDMIVDNTKNTQTGAIVTREDRSRDLLIIDRKLVVVAGVRRRQQDRARTRCSSSSIRSAQGWKLVDTQKPIETTPTLYRFKGTASAGKVTTLTVEGRDRAERDDRDARRRTSGSSCATAAPARFRRTSATRSPRRSS